MKKLCIAACVTIVALAAIKFAMINAVEGITYDEFRDGIVDNLDNVEELKKLSNDISSDDLKKLIEDNIIGMHDTFITLFRTASEEKNKNNKDWAEVLVQFNEKLKAIGAFSKELIIKETSGEELPIQNGTGFWVYVLGNDVKFGESLRDAIKLHAKAKAHKNINNLAHAVYNISLE